MRAVFGFAHRRPFAACGLRNRLRGANAEHASQRHRGQQHAPHGAAALRYPHEKLPRSPPPTRRAHTGPVASNARRMRQRKRDNRVRLCCKQAAIAKWPPDAASLVPRPSTGYAQLLGTRTHTQRFGLKGTWKRIIAMPSCRFSGQNSGTRGQSCAQLQNGRAWSCGQPVGLNPPPAVWRSRGRLIRMPG